jgi:Fe-S cluster assembly protein SufD
MTLKEKAKSLRRNQTKAEKKLWRYLRNRQINGLKFYRQYIIEPYICDFVCRDFDIIIEADGGQHCDNESDFKRDKYLREKGYVIIRYWNNDILNNIEGVIEDMKKKIETLTPALSLKGEGGTLPTSKLERWKYSNLPAFVKGEYVDEPLALSYKGQESFLKNTCADNIIWAHDDYLDMDLWQGIQGTNTLEIPEDNHVDKPVRIGFNIPQNIRQSGHVDIILRKGASLTIYEHIQAEGWCLRSMTITLVEGAKLTHIRTGEGQGIVTNLTQVTLAENATYKAYALNTYGAFTRDQIHARLDGEGAECYLSGSKILNGKQHCDTTILIEHRAPNCHSNQNYRNLLDDQSRGVFQGKVHVHQIAQKTDGYQLCNSVLLSDKAEMNTKPELEIYADDVQCSHGATTAAPDEEPLFYLQARGIPEAQARAMLLSAFLYESLEALEDKEVSEYLTQEISKALHF